MPPNDSIFGCLTVNNKTQETIKIPLATSKQFQGIKTPPYVVALGGVAPTTYGDLESKFDFVAVFRTENEEGINETVSVGYKGKVEVLDLKVNWDMTTNFQQPLSIY